MIERAPFGATGHESSRVIFGAAALASASKADADRTRELIERHEINHIDVAASYGDAELRIAPWLRDARVLPRHQDRRAHLRRRQGADPPLAGPPAGRPRGLDPAPQPRRRDRVGHRAEPRRRARGLPGGARRGPGALHRRDRPRAVACRRCTPAASAASTSTPCCARTTSSRCATTATRRPSTSSPRLCAERDVALQTIKSLARAPWEGREQTASTWYEPLTDQADIDRAVHWVLGNPQVFLLTTGDVDVLPKLLDAAARYETRPSDERHGVAAAHSAVHLAVRLPGGAELGAVAARRARVGRDELRLVAPGEHGAGADAPADQAARRPRRRRRTIRPRPRSARGPAARRPR